jgi:NAD(P)-dependent dehydrogenase (short-subunit alcohol dehydrogenase family)
MPAYRCPYNVESSTRHIYNATILISLHYSATKFALEGLSESIQYELEPFGIKIIVIEPGGVGSNFLKNLKMATKASDPFDSPYRSMQSSISEYFKQWAQNTIHPSEIAKVILQDYNPDFRYVVGKDPHIGNFDIADDHFLIGKSATAKNIWKAIRYLPDTSQINPLFFGLIIMQL